MAERIMIPARFGMRARGRAGGGTPEGRLVCRLCAALDLVSRNPLIQFNAIPLPWESQVGRCRNCSRQMPAQCVHDVEVGDVG